MQKMGITLDTNLPAVRAVANGDVINDKIEDTIKRLSSGLRISLSEDDASSMAIADSLHQQSMSLHEAIKNANDGIGVMQIADKGISQQVDLLTNIRTRAIYAATEGHSKDSLDALKQEAVQLVDEINKIAKTTSYNELSLLSGGFINKDFHIGSGDKTFLRVSIPSTTTENLGRVRYETGATITASSVVKLKLRDVNGREVVLEDAVISTSSGKGIGTLVDIVNKHSETLGIKARASVESTASKPLGEDAVGTDTTIENIVINGVTIGNFNIYGKDDKESLVTSINSVETDTGVRASLDIRGHLHLLSIDGRGIEVNADRNAYLLHLGNVTDESGHQNYGRLTLSQIYEPRDIVLGGSNVTAIGFNSGQEVESVIELDNITNDFSIEQACAMGLYANSNVNDLELDKTAGRVLSGLHTIAGSNAMIDSIDVALSSLKKIRSVVAATQNKLTSSVDSTLSLRTNIQTSESQLRDADYATETTNLSLGQSLLQANIYAISKSNSIRELILELIRA